MPRGLPGLRTSQFGTWKDQSLYRRRKKEVSRPPTDEERAEAKRRLDAATRMIGRMGGVAEEDLDLFVQDTAAYRRLCEQRSQQRALTKLVDREARTSVEGDTDLNHDNLEGGE